MLTITAPRSHFAASERDMGMTAPVADAPIAILTALSSTVAMGVQNAASRIVFAIHTGAKAHP